MKGVAIAGIAGSVALVAAAVAGRDHWHAAHANIRRYSMPGPRSYDLAAGLLFRDRYRAIAETIADEVPAGSRLLDVGCGPGEVLVRLATIAPAIETTGLDVDAAMIAGARRKAEEFGSDGPSFVVADVASMPFADLEHSTVSARMTFHESTCRYTHWCWS